MKLKMGAYAFLCGQPAHKANPHNPSTRLCPRHPSLIETMEGKIEGRVGGMLDALQNRHKTNFSWLLKLPPQTARQIFGKN